MASLLGLGLFIGRCGVSVGILDLLELVCVHRILELRLQFAGVEASMNCSQVEDAMQQIPALRIARDGTAAPPVSRRLALGPSIDSNIF